MGGAQIVSVVLLGGIFIGDTLSLLPSPVISVVLKSTLQYLGVLDR